MPTSQTTTAKEAVRPYAEAVLCRRSLSDFVRRAWPHIERKDLVWNWHLDVICDRLQRVTEGDIDRLVICVPPGFGKSLLTSVFWPAWEWLRDPTIRGQYLSGSESVQIRDAVRCRTLLQSEWYQGIKARLGLGWDFADDQNQKTYYKNTEQGFRASGVIGGKVTGDRADKQVLDDPYDIKEATRGTEARIRERMREVVRDWDDVLVDRLNDEQTDPRVLIMQRVHQEDLAGALMRRDDYEVVNIRMEYEPSDPYQYERDPRQNKGDLAFPARYPPEVVDERKRASNYEATNNQAPSSGGGGVISKSWLYQDPDAHNPQLKPIKLYRELPDLETFDYIAQSWDFSKGSQADDASYSCGHIYGWRKRTLWLFPVEMREQAKFNRMLEMVESVCGAWPDVTKKLVEPKASGPEVVQQMRRKVGRFIEVEPDGPKDVRADIASEPLECGDYRLPHPVIAPWVRDWAEELVDFPGRFDDRVDTFSQFVLYTQKHDHHEPPAPNRGDGATMAHHQQAPI